MAKKRRQPDALQSANDEAAESGDEYSIQKLILPDSIVVT